MQNTSLSSSQNLIRIGNLPNASIATFALKEEGPAVIVARDDRDMAELRAFLQFFAHDQNIIELPAWDCKPYDRVSPRVDISAQRASSLMRLAHGEKGILLTTQNAVMQKLPPQNLMKKYGLELKLGYELDFDALHGFAQASGYTSVPTVRGAGEYTVRGGIVDIFPSGFEAPVRIDLFGDIIDRLRYFDPETQRSSAALDGLRLAPSDELIYSQDSIARFRDGYRALRGVPKGDDLLYENVTAGLRPQGIEHYLPLFYQALARFSDYLEPDWRIFAREDFQERISNRFSDLSEHQSAKDESQIMPTPNALYLDGAGALEQFSQHRFYLCAFGSIPTGANAIDAGFVPARDFAPERANQTGKLYSEISQYINNEQKSRSVLLACTSEGSRARMQNLLEEYDVKNTNLIECVEDLTSGVDLCVLPISHGFSTPTRVILSEADILGERLFRRKKRRRADAAMIGEITNFTDASFFVRYFTMCTLYIYQKKTSVSVT